MKDFLAQYMPVDASEHGAVLDNLNAMVHVLMLVLFVFWGAYFLFVIWRFSAKRNPKASYRGMQSHWSTWSEVAVAVIEVVLLVGISIPAWSRWTTKPPTSSNPLEIRLVAEQFAWNLHYAGADGVFGKTAVKFVSSTNPIGLDPDDPAGKDDITTLNQLHIELKRPVIIHVSSKDVIHSFSLPTMRVKQDAIPGMDVPVHFTPIRTNEGATWEIACAQLCGLGHYRMRGQFFVHTHDEFVKWAKSAAPENPETATPNPVPSATPAEPVNPATTTAAAPAHPTT
jgi:cytochrome c oxidase subunit 2